MPCLGPVALSMIILGKFGGVNELDFRNLSQYVKEDVNVLFSFLKDIVYPAKKIDMSSDLYCLSGLVNVCSHFKVRWHVLIFLSMRIFFFVDPGSRTILEQIGGVVPMNGDESNYMSIMQRLESELSLPYFPGFRSCEFSSIYWTLPKHTKISIWIFDTYSQSKRIHVNECIISRYFHGKLGCEVHLLRPPLISHQVSSSCGLVGKDILTSIRNNPRMLHDENELTKIIE